MKSPIICIIAGISLSTHSFASTAYLDSQYELQLCKGRWVWTEVWTETKTTPAVTKDVEEKQIVSGERPSTTREETKSENVSCFATPTVCTPDRVRSLCDTKKASWGIKADQLISSDFNVISDYLENVDRGGSIKKWRNISAACSVRFRPMEAFRDEISYNPPLFKTIEITPAKTDTISKSKEGSSNLNTPRTELSALETGHAYKTLVCSSGDHIANDTEQSALEKFHFLTVQLNAFDARGINPNTCSEEDPVCAEYRSIIKNYYAIIFEPIQSLLSFDQFIEISERQRTKYPQVGYPEHLKEIIIDEPVFSSL